LIFIPGYDPTALHVHRLNESGACKKPNMFPCRWRHIFAPKRLHISVTMHDVAPKKTVTLWLKVKPRDAVNTGKYSPVFRRRLPLPASGFILYYFVWYYITYINIHSFSILSDDRFKASSKTIPPPSAI